MSWAAVGKWALRTLGPVVAEKLIEGLTTDRPEPEPEPEPPAAPKKKTTRKKKR